MDSYNLPYLYVGSVMQVGGYGDLLLPVMPGAIDHMSTTRVYTMQTDGQIVTFTKQPQEVLVGIGIDFRRFLAMGEILESAAVVNALFLRVEGSTAFVAISGGADGETLRVTVTGQGDKGSVVEGELKVVIKEV